MSDVPAAQSSPARDCPTRPRASEEYIRRYERSPVDVLRIVVFASIALVLLALALWVEDSILGLEEDLIELLGFLDPSIERVLHGSIELVLALIMVGVWLVPLVTRRYRLFGYIATASLLALVSMTLVDWLVERQTSTVLTNTLAARAGLDADVSSGVVGLAQLAAVFIAVGPFVTRRWRRAGAVTIGVVFLVRLLVSVRLPVDALVALPIGATCGAAVLFAYGRPDRRPTRGALAAALADAGLAVDEIHPAKVDARGSTPYFATMADGTGLFVKVLGSGERAADLLFRVYRFLRLKDVGDDRPFSSLRRTIEHEALVALLARDVGVRTPRLRGVVNVGSDSMLLAYETIDGDSLDRLDDAESTDDLMRRTWDQVALLHRHRIAHRDLRRANVFVADHTEPWLIDFGFSEVAVDLEILDADVAQLLASFALVAGAERTVAAAVAAVGVDAVGRALPRLQRQALSGATQSSLAEHKGLLEQLQQEVAEQCGVEEVEFAQLERVDRGAVVTVGALALATYFLFPQFADLPGIIDQVQAANWGWIPLVMVASAMTYVAASLSLSGAISQRLPAGPVFVSAVACSFASKLAPASLGGMALSIRFLQKQGVDRAVAVSGIGLNTLAGLVGHLGLVGVFLVWAGRDAFGSLALPDPKWFLLGVGIAGALILAGLAIPATRRLLRDRLLPVVARALDGVGDVVGRPGKVVMLMGGSALVTLAYLATLYFSTRAFGGGLPLATVGAVFLVGAAVGQAAPTPGGLGAMEAALIGGLTAAGMDGTIAVPAVFLYRLFTFWVPILPGWLAFHWMERNDYL